MAALPSSSKSNQRELFRVYVDETGDRGTGPKSSPFFVFAAVVIRDSKKQKLIDFVDQLPSDVGKPTKKVKWRNFEHYERLVVAQKMKALPIKLIYVIVPKATMRPGTRMHTQTDAFYNFAAKLLVERVSWCVNDHNAEAKVMFEKVKGFSTHIVTDYFDLLRKKNERNIEWAAIHPKIEVASPANVKGLIAADLAAGALDAAIRPEQHTGMYEHSYIEEISARIVRRSTPPRALGHGLKVLGENTTLTQLPWWNKCNLDEAVVLEGQVASTAS